MAKLFFRYCDYYLKDYIDVQEYALNQDGWAMLIKIKSSKTIRKYYEKVTSRRKSKKDLEVSFTTMPIWKILSERVRLFISTYVRMSNKILGREGSLVRRKYKRYRFDSLTQAQSYVSKLRNGGHDTQQTEEKYRGLSEHFGMAGNLITNPFRSSLWVEICEKKEQIAQKLVEVFEGEMPVLQRIGELVALKCELNKSAVNSPPKTPPKH